MICFKKRMIDKMDLYMDCLTRSGLRIEWFSKWFNIQSVWGSKNRQTYQKNKFSKFYLLILINTLDKCNDEMSPEDIQTLIYTTGKENGYSKNLRDWFKLIYEVVFGDENGPRMGFFISFFGVKETKDLIKNKIK